MVICWQAKNSGYGWLLIEKHEKLIVGVFLGDRRRQSAQKLWDSLPSVYRQTK